MYVGIKECAAYFGVNSKTIREMCKNGKVPCVLLGNRYRINLEEAEKKLLADEQRRIEEKEAREFAAKREKERRRTHKSFNYLAALNALEMQIN